MQDMVGQDSLSDLFSPTLFIQGLDRPDELVNFGEKRSDLPNQWEKACRASADNGTGEMERDGKKKLAGLRAREKKKKYLENLEQSVKTIQAQIENTEGEIYKCKDQLVEAIKTSLSTGCNEHAFTFAQLEQEASEEYPDEDKINLLMDLIQNRIGANAKERQANLDYNFKQIINSMFPALHRYFMHAAAKNSDIFLQSMTLDNLNSGSGSWSQEIYRIVKLNLQQMQEIQKMKTEFLKKRRDTVKYIQRLKAIKEELKKQEERFERTINDIREDMSPVQSAKLIVFGEKNKLRQQFCILTDELVDEAESSCLQNGQTTTAT